MGGHREHDQLEELPTRGGRVPDDRVDNNPEEDAWTEGER